MGVNTCSIVEEEEEEEEEEWDEQEEKEEQTVPLHEPTSQIQPNLTYV